MQDSVNSLDLNGVILIKKGVFTKAPKTESSIIDVVIPDFIVSLLEELKIIV